MHNEMASLKENRTWKLVDLPEGKRPIDCKWVFKLKLNKDKSIRYKARLVAKGFTQKEGIDYNETYSSVVKYTSIRYLIALAAKMNLHIRQLDVVTAFLHGSLQEEIFMLQPEGFKDNSAKVCKLNKSLYGLKQASRNWYEKLTNFLEKNGMQRCNADSCVYYSSTKEGTIILAVYVDDMLCFTDNIALEDRLVELLKGEFEISDLGDASSVVGMRITRNETNKSITGWMQSCRKSDGYIDKTVIR